MNKMHDNSKRNRILGLAIGLIVFVILLHFRFDRMEFSSWALRTPMGEFSYAISKNMITDVISVEQDFAEKLWVFFQLIYIACVWFFRGCIGHWVIKIVTLGYKKI